MVVGFSEVIHDVSSRLVPGSRPVFIDLFRGVKTKPQLARTGQRADPVQVGHSKSATQKRAWDMPTSQSNSVLETWTHADLNEAAAAADAFACG